MTEQEIQEWTIKQNKLNPAWAPYQFEPKPEPETDTDEEYLAWLAKQNDDAGDEIIVPPVTDATLFDTELSIFNYIQAAGIENPLVVLESESLIPWINRWIDEQTARPLVLSFGAFNHWSQTNHDLFFTKTAALDAYEEVLVSRYPHRFEAPKIIKADEWIKFFQQYGASGVVGGSVDREARIAIDKALQQGYTPGSRITESLTAVYYFSDPGEAAFARMAF